MSKSVMLRSPDVRAIVRLVGECRDLGDDWSAWLGHCLQGLMMLIDGELGLGGEVGGARGGVWLNEISPPAMTGRPGFDFDPGRIVEVIQQHNLVPGESRFVDGYLVRWLREDGIALSNRDLFAVREWEASTDMRTVGEAWGTDATILCCREIPSAGPSSGEVLDLSVFREEGRRPFGGRECAIVREVVAALVPLLGGRLARFGEPSPAGLPPRARQVLACFLEGDGDKQAAARLGIGVHTVNQYAKQIYKHFGVRSRPELLARWVRRGWTSRAPEDLGAPDGR